MNTRTLTKDLVLCFGDSHDGVLGIPCLTKDKHVIEASYFFGDDKPKNIICVSSQASCPMKCAFCELGGEKFGRNLTPQEMYDQAALILEEARLRGLAKDGAPHKINIANSGEPLLNPDIVAGLETLSRLKTSFKVSTVLPKGQHVQERVGAIARFAAQYDRPVQLQISLISTSERERLSLAGSGAADFASVRAAAEAWRTLNPNGRKVNLSLILTGEADMNMSKAVSLFPPELFRFRFREYVPTTNGQKNWCWPIPSDMLIALKAQFRAHGYEVFDHASPTPIEKKFNLVANSIRRMYLEMIVNK